MEKRPQAGLLTLPYHLRQVPLGVPRSLPGLPLPWDSFRVSESGPRGLRRALGGGGGAEAGPYLPLRLDGAFEPAFLRKRNRRERQRVRCVNEDTRASGTTCPRAGGQAPPAKWRLSAPPSATSSSSRRCWSATHGHRRVRPVPAPRAGPNATATASPRPHRRRLQQQRARGRGQLASVPAPGPPAALRAFGVCSKVPSGGSLHCYLTLPPPPRRHPCSPVNLRK